VTFVPLNEASHHMLMPNAIYQKVLQLWPQIEMKIVTEKKFFRKKHKNVKSTEKKKRLNKNSHPWTCLVKLFTRVIYSVH
jgi:hypothetical protein